MHWRRNLFKVPSGKAGKAFVRELTRLFQAYADGSSLESVALKAAMVMPALLLQKPHPRSKAKEHTLHLERHLRLWAEGDLGGLLKEGRTIQHQFTRQRPNQSRSAQQIPRRFAKLMKEGKVRAALQLIDDDESGGPLHLDSQIAFDGSCAPSETVREVLLKKHPPKQPPKPSSITPDSPTTEPHPVLFGRIDGQLIRSSALRTDGAAGPSGLDAAAWKRMCTSFKSASADLCDSLASTTRRICSCFVDPRGLSAFVACRLIALDKHPGVSVGETSRRIVGRAIAASISDDIQDAAGPLQVCAGHLSGCEAAVHAMRQVSEAPDTDAIILVDASNAFNSLNRQAALRNIHKLCPALSKALINTYREDVELFINGEVLLSQEGTTQGEPLAMAMYAIAITPLIHRLEDRATKQVWFADDATAGGGLNHLKAWWDRISAIGPDYGYYPNASKTWLIVKEANLEEATALFQGTGVSITVDGRRHLGAAIGTHSFVENYVQRKVSGWIFLLAICANAILPITHDYTLIERLSSIATTQPHAAYAAFTHGLTSKWTYLARTIPDIEDLLQPLEDAIRQQFLPSLTGQVAFGDAARDLMALLVRLGGLGVINPSRQSTAHNNMSKKITAPLVALILQQSHVLSPETKDEQLRARKDSRTLHRQRESTAASDLKKRLPRNLQKLWKHPRRRVPRVGSPPCQSLSMDSPSTREHSEMPSAYGMAGVRYVFLPIAGKFTIEHALSCSRGGFPSIRHNEIRDIKLTF